LIFKKVNNIRGENASFPTARRTAGIGITATAATGDHRATAFDAMFGGAARTEA
jgi:hypothetical protein